MDMSRNTKAEIYRVYEKSKCLRCMSPVKVPIDKLWKLLKGGVTHVDAKFSVSEYSAGPGTSVGFYMDEYGGMNINILEELSDESRVALNSFLMLAVAKFNHSLNERSKLNQSTSTPGLAANKV